VILSQQLTFDFKGEGVAERLIRAYQEQARQRENIGSIVCQTASDNYFAHKVYHRFGLKPIDNVLIMD
jgi:RimJ/RimL family protein N-acetyltransferase